MLDEIINGAVEAPQEATREEVCDTITISRDTFMNTAQKVSEQIIEADEKRRKEKSDGSANKDLFSVAQVLVHIDYAIKLCAELFGKEDNK